MKSEINKLHESLQNHILYKKINNLENLKIFMTWHSFAVWDFMSLLKSLQNRITCTSLPWRPSKQPKELVRFINEIVLGEESDSDEKCGYTDHFSMYLKAMQEVGIDTSALFHVIDTLDFSSLPREIRSFVTYNLDLSLNGKDHEIAAAFFFGRENLVPDIFTPIVKSLESADINAPSLLYYLKRHIELDGGEHSRLANKCLESLIGNDETKRIEAFETAKTSLILRESMWSYIVGQIEKTSGNIDRQSH